MKKIDLTLVADCAFYGFAAWFLSIGLLRYFRMQLTPAAILSSLISFSVTGVVFLLSYHRRLKKRLSKKETEAQEALLLHLALEKEERVRAALLTAFLADKKTAQCQDDALFVDGALCIPRFTMQPLSADEVARILRAHGQKSVKILCNSLTPEAEKLAASFGIEIMRKNEIYSLFTRTETIPSPLILAELPRKSIKRTLRRIVSKKSARPFFASGILLLIMSLFTFFPIYYLISGSVLTILAIFVRFIGFSAETA